MKVDLRLKKDFLLGKLSHEIPWVEMGRSLRPIPPTAQVYKMIVISHHIYTSFISLSAKRNKTIKYSRKSIGIMA
jgi:hypothetical protein